jgi:hypothetical protein
LPIVYLKNAHKSSKTKEKRAETKRTFVRLFVVAYSKAITYGS